VALATLISSVKSWVCTAIVVTEAVEMLVNAVSVLMVEIVECKVFVVSMEE